MCECYRTNQHETGRVTSAASSWQPWYHTLHRRVDDDDAGSSRQDRRKFNRAHGVWRGWLVSVSRPGRSLSAELRREIFTFCSLAPVTSWSAYRALRLTSAGRTSSALPDASWASSRKTILPTRLPGGALTVSGSTNRSLKVMPLGVHGKMRR